MELEAHWIPSRNWN